MAFGPRIPGTPESRAAGDWILDHLRRYGWETSEQVFEHRGVELRNLSGLRATGSEERLLLGAHYDTRPVADRDRRSPTLPVPGANDGASGVAVLLELARVLPWSLPNCSVRLVFFDAEDSGGIAGWDYIVGSAHFARNMDDDPTAVVIVDMVGDRNLELYLENNSDPELAAEIWRLAADLGYSAFIPEVKYSILDDHYPFIERQIPAIDIIDFDYPYWHTTDDTADKVAPDSLEQVGRTLQVWVEDRCK